MGLELPGEERRLCASVPDGIARDRVVAIARALCGDLTTRAPPSEVLGLDVSPLLLIQMGLLFAGGTGRAARRSTRLLGLWRRSWALGAAGALPKDRLVGEALEPRGRGELGALREEAWPESNCSGGRRVNPVVVP